MFVFRLQSVLKHRSRRVDEEARRLGRIENSLMELRGRIAESERRREDAARRGGEAMRRGCDVEGWRRTSDYLDRLRRRLQELRSAERELLKRVEQQRRILREAQREKEVLEKLRDRQLEAWREQSRREERKEMDDVGGRRFLGSGCRTGVPADSGGA